MSTKRFTGLIVLAIAGLLAAGCGGGSSSTSSTSSASSTSSTSSSTPSATKVAGKLVIDNESGSTWTCQFNPFNPAVTLTSLAAANLYTSALPPAGTVTSLIERINTRPSCV